MSKLIRSFYLLSFIAIGLSNAAIAQNQAGAQFDDERWKVAGFESRLEVEQAVSRIKEAARQKDVRLIYDMFMGASTAVYCRTPEGVSLRSFPRLDDVEGLQILWDALLQHEDFAPLSSLTYDDLFMNYRGAAATRHKRLLWISKYVEADGITPPKIYSISSPIPCDELTALFSGERSDLPQNDPWTVGGFESRDEVEHIISRIRDAAQQADIRPIEDVLPDFPTFIGCDAGPEFLGKSQLRIDDMDAMQSLWTGLLQYKVFSLLKTLSYEDLRFDEYGAVFSGADIISISKRSEDGALMTAPQISQMNSYLRCEVLADWLTG